jgi:N-methylhydantoinase B
VIDPVTFEVLRHRLSTIVEEGAAILRNISGSSSVAQSNDCNVAILDETGDGVVIGRNIASHSIACIRTTRYILREYAENPGIGPGDMFFTNHPYIGTPHQCCGALVAPVFVDGAIVAWSGVGIHFGDVGGAVPGQVSIGAQSIWSEAMPVPPIKIVECGVLRKDIEEDFLLRSRTRVQNAVDLKAMIGSLNAVNRRVLSLVERYGVAVFDEAIQRIISTSETKLRSILREIPDGEWSCENYLDYYDRDKLDVYACRLTLTKLADSLVFDFTKSSRQAPAVINATFGTTESWLLRVMLGIFGFAVTRCPAAVLRVLEIKTTEGTIVDCKWPGGVCKGTTSVSQSVWHASIHCLGQMLLGSEKYAERGAAVPRGLVALLDLQGNDQYGAPFAAVISEMANAAGSAAKRTRDGIDTGGSFDPEVSTPNVESNESRYPVLYVYRRQRTDGGGAGRFRGGVGLSIAFVPYDVEGIANVMIHSHGVTFPTASGIAGGHPGAINWLRIKRRTNLKELFSGGIMPREGSEIVAETDEIPAPFSYTQLSSDDVFVSAGGGGGGYGDPIERDPELVLRDHRKGLVSRGGAEEQFGVVLQSGEGTIDTAATDTRRAALREGRRREAAPLDRAGKGPALLCKCGARDGVALRETLHRAEALPPHRTDEIPPYAIREYFCPSCWTLLETEVFVAQTKP